MISDSYEKNVYFSHRHSVDEIIYIELHGMQPWHVLIRTAEAQKKNHLNFIESMEKIMKVNKFVIKIAC